MKQMRVLACNMLWLFTFILFVQVSGSSDVSDTDFIVFVDHERRGLYYVNHRGNQTRFPIVYTQIYSPNDVSYNPHTGEVVWTEKGQGDELFPRILSTNVNQVNSKEDVTPTKYLLPLSTDITGLAVDIISGNIYYSSSSTDHYIALVTADYRWHKTLIREALWGPHGIALDPTTGLMFWTDWDEDNARVSRANMDGFQRQAIISQNLNKPTGIATDIRGKKVYFCNDDRIEEINYDGTERRVLYSGQITIMAITVGEHFIYFTQKEQSAIQKLVLSTGDVTTLGNPVLGSTDYRGIYFFDKAYVKHGVEVGSGCSSSPCSHMCAPSGANKQYSCLCPDGFQISQDTCTPLPFRDFLLVSDYSRQGLFQLDLSALQVRRLDILGMDKPKGLDYDKQEGKVFWVDEKLSWIAMACLDSTCGGIVKQFPASEMVDLWGLQLDPQNKRIYYSENRNNIISYVSYDGTETKNIIEQTNLRGPRHIALDLRDRMIYFSDAASLQGSIQRASMDDGSSQEVLVSDNVRSPTGLALDLFNNKMYWCDLFNKDIRVANLDGSNPQVLYENQNYAFLGLALSGTSLYFSTENSHYLYKLDVDNPSNVETVGPQDFLSVYDIVYSGIGLVDLNITGSRRLLLPQGEVIHNPQTGTPYTTPGTTNNVDGDGSTDGNNNTLLIILVVVGVVVLIALLVVVTIMFHKVRQSRAKLNDEGANYIVRGNSSTPANSNGAPGAGTGGSGPPRAGDHSAVKPPPPLENLQVKDPENWPSWSEGTSNPAFEHSPPPYTNQPTDYGQQPSVGLIRHSAFFHSNKETRPTSKPT